MSPNLRAARKQIGYPLYGADFDPLNPDFLLVGGGGGSTSSGVPNRISLLDVSRSDLNEIVDINLATDEDSVTSLAIADSDEGSLTAYAGINSSVRDQDAGKNEHFRSFRIGLPARKRKADGSEKSATSVASSGSVKSQALARTALFKSATGPKSEAYQRVLRVAPAHKAGGKRLAAVSTGLAPQNEVLVLQVTPAPSLSNVISRINTEHVEAADLDIIPVEDEAQSHVLAYCTDHDVYLQHILSSSGSSIKEPFQTYSTASSGRRSKIRCLRWLNSRYLLLLCNRPAGGGAELHILKTDKDYTQAQQVLLKILAKSTKQAVGLATAALSATTKGGQQFVVAVAGQDSSIEILSIDLSPGAGMTRFRQYVHLRDVHSGPITRITFSHFRPPSLPVTKETTPQYLRLASVGVDLNVVVHTLPLRPYPAVYSKEPRYVLIPPPETLQNAINISVALFIIGIVAFCMQVFCEIRGVVPPTLHAQTWLSPHWQQKLAVPYPAYAHHGTPGPVIPESMPEVLNDVISATTETVVDAAEAGATYLQDLVSAQQAVPEMRDQEIVVRDFSASRSSGGGDAGDNVDAEIHHRDSDFVKNDKSIKKWDQLSEKQGEAVLKGILFSELGAAVGAAVRGG